MLAIMKIIGPTSNSFISQRLKLNYVDWGNPDAPPLILQHGGRDHCRSWDWVAEELRDDWHVICPDLRGHGDSAWSADGNYSFNAYVYDFAQLVHTLGYDKVNIVAHSLGGNITARFAGLYPEKVAKYVNIEGLGLTPQDLLDRKRLPMADLFREWIDKKRAASGRAPRRYPTMEAAFRRMIEENDYLTEEQARHLTVHGTSRNEDGTFSWKFDPYLNVWPFSDLTPEQIQSLWSAISCPTLLLWGKDSFFPSPAQDGRLNYFQNAKLVEFENAGHWLHHDQFKRFMGELRAFL